MKFSLAVLVACLAFSLEWQNGQESLVTALVIPFGTTRPLGRCSGRSMSGVCQATVVPNAPVEGASTDSPWSGQLLEQVAAAADDATQWGEMFGLGSSETAFFALFRGIRNSVPLGLKGQPFLMKQADIVKALRYDDQSPFAGFFTRADLNKAVNDDFLDADRGSTDNRKGWKITSVSEPRGNSYEEARMTMEEVEAALEKGTVVFNSAGAHIPKLAGANLACTDATSLPCAINLYITAPGKRTSAPPHTDKQDVVVVQTSGTKHWRIYSPPDPAMKPTADMFARGKGPDNLPLYAMETDLGCKLLLEATLDVGDVLFVPAAFPHTTDTANETNENPSIHLTFGIDTHIWDLDYLSARRLALRRAGISDTALGQTKEEENRYEGRVNELPAEIRSDLFDSFPLGLLDSTPEGEALLDTTSSELQRISYEVDAETASAVDPSIWKGTASRVRQQGMELLEIHRDMFLEAIEEGRIRAAEEAMTAHLEVSQVRKAMSPERLQRLSLFRVPRYFQKISESKKALVEWSFAGTAPSVTKGGEAALPENWAFTLPVKVGDIVEADLGGAFFPAKVTRVAPGGSSFDVQFFDGDKESGLERGMIKLLKPPANPNEEVDTTNMTPKQLKRWKKQQEKNQ